MWASSCIHVRTVGERWLQILILVLQIPWRPGVWSAKLCVSGKLNQIFTVHSVLAQVFLTLHKLQLNIPPKRLKLIEVSIDRLSEWTNWTEYSLHSPWHS